MARDVEPAMARDIEPAMAGAKNPRDFSRGRLAPSDPSTKANRYRCEVNLYNGIVSDRKRL